MARDRMPRISVHDRSSVKLAWSNLLLEPLCVLYIANPKNLRGSRTSSEIPCAKDAKFGKELFS